MFHDSSKQYIKNSKPASLHLQATCQPKITFWQLIVQRFTANRDNRRTKVALSMLDNHLLEDIGQPARNKPFIFWNL